MFNIAQNLDPSLLSKLAVQVPNPDFPIKNEYFTPYNSGQVADTTDPINVWGEGMEGSSEISQMKTAYSDYAAIFNYSSGLQFHMKALELRSKTGDVPYCTKNCRWLISKSNDRCGAAYVNLALMSETLEEVLQHYKDAMKSCWASVDKTNIEIRGAVTEKNYWDCIPLRTYQRALQGAALCLVKLKRWEEAKELYIELATKVDAVKPKSYSSYKNWRYHYPLVFIQCGLYQEALSFMAKQKCCYSLNSSSLAWVWNTTFCQIKLGKLTTIDPSFYTMDNNSISGQETPSGCNVRISHHNVHMWKYFLSHFGDHDQDFVDVPLKKIPVCMTAPDDELQAQIYWNRHREMWLNHPSVMNKVRKIRNRCLVDALFNPGDIFKHMAPSYKIDVTKKVQTVPFLNIMFRQGCDATHVAQDNHPIGNIAGNSSIPPLLRVQYMNMLIKQGFRIDTVDLGQQLNPLNKGCYYACNSENGGAPIRLLLEHKADPWSSPNPFSPQPHLSPANMAANQGNWLAILTIVQFNEKQATEARLGSMLIHTLGTSCYFCLKGILAKKCQRCVSDEPHDKDCSFEKAVEVLLAYGLHPTKFLTNKSVQSVIQRYSFTTAEIKQHPLYKYFQRQYKNRAALKTKYEKLRIKSNVSTSAAPRSSASRSNANSNTNGSTVASNNAKPAVAKKAAPSKRETKEATAATANSTKENDLTHCSECSKTDAEFKLCGRCKAVVYCSVDCQRKAWPTHKKICKKPE